MAQNIIIADALFRFFPQSPSLRRHFSATTGIGISLARTKATERRAKRNESENKIEIIESEKGNFRMFI